MTDTSITDDLEADAPASEPTPQPTPQPTFADFDVRPEIVEALAAVDIVHPFPIQAMTLPVALGGHDIIGQAKTGTGKTLGFGVPILQRIVTPTDEGFESLAKPGKPQALVVCPTRELAVQVAGDLERAGTRRGARVITVYGGRAYEPQIDTLRKGVEIVVGTPGRLIDLAKQGHLDLSQARTVVLDEADEMLDLGFLPDVETLMAQTSPTRQTMLFSATMPGAIVALARRYMRQPTHIRAMGDPDENAHTVKAIEQFVYRAHALDKVEMLARILQARGRGLTLVFSRTKRTAAKVADDLTERGFAAAAIHGDLGQGAREQALRAFRHGNVDVLVATDVAARGIDVENVTHVVNFQCPEDEKTYVHRIGRTARAGNTGIAVTFVDWDDIPRWGLINRQLDLGIPDPEETYSSSDHLYAELDIPTDVTGRLGKAQQTRAGLDAEELEDLGETGKASGRRGNRPERSEGSGGSERSERSERSGRPERQRGSAEERPRRDRNRRRTVRTHTDGESTAEAPAPAEATQTSDATSRRPRRRRRRGGNSDTAPASTEG
jgi:superfamily II DNA/RNA helicase